MLVALLIGVVFVAAVPKSVFADDSVTTFIPQAVIDGQSKAGLDVYIGYCYTTATDGFNAPYGALKNNGNPTSENIGNGDWFNTGFGTTHGSPSNIQKAADTVVREQILGWKNNETLWCDNLNKAGTTGTGTGLLDKANDMFGWGGMVQGACKLGLVRQNNSSCVSGDGDFKRGNWTAQATTTDTSPSFDSNAASYVRGYLSCVYNGGTPNFVKVSTASADTKATQKYTYSTVTLSNDKAAVEQVYDTGSGNCGAQSHGGNNAQAYADWLNANPAMLKQANAPIATKNDPINGQGKAVCTGGSLGWILCPLTDMASNMINSLAGLIQSLLTYQPLLGSTQGATIQKIWSIVVGIANLLLIVAFLIVIFSQATSIGLSAYGIKKMLPRIIAAAILINLSFFICALAVDLSNIIGASVQGIIQSASAQLPAASGVKLAAEPWNIGFVALTTTLIAGTFVTGAIFYIFPFLLTAALTLLTAFVVLAVRQILITLLIIVAPLAFAAFVLPNTEDLYKKWQKLFVVLLVMYPLVMFIFYGSSFMSQLILMTKDQTQSGANQFFTDVIAFIMLFVPLFILPTLMKLAGGILERFGGIVNDRSKGLVDRTRGWAQNEQKRSTISQIMQARKNAGDVNAQQRAYTRMGTRTGKVLTWQPSKNTNQILGAQVVEANTKIHKQRVDFARADVAEKYNASNGAHRVTMASEALKAARSGNQVQMDAILAHAATTGPDEFDDVYRQMQTAMRTEAGPGALLKGGKYHKATKEAMGYVNVNYGADLGPKNRALTTVLQAAEPDVAVRDRMVNDPGIQTYYTKMSAAKVAAFSSDTAKASAQFLDDTILHQLIHDPTIAGSVGTSARDAFLAEEAARAAGTTRTPVGGAPRPVVW